MDIKLSDCGLFVDETLPYVSANPDILLLCSCCEKTCVEIKCRYSINCIEPCYSNLEYLRLCDGKTVLKTSHKYYIQCMFQMAVTGTMENYFVVWTPHEMIIDQIYLIRYLHVVVSFVISKNLKILKISDNNRPKI